MELLQSPWIKKFFETHPWLATTCGIVALSYLALVGLGRLFEVWRSFRTRRAILEEQKIVTEILKIRYDIEVLRKQHDLPDLTLTEQPVGAPVRRGVEAYTGTTGAHPRFGISLPELPSFSFSPVLSLFKFSLERPEPGMARAYWALKLLARALLVFIALVILIMTLVPGPASNDTTGGAQGTAAGVLVLLGGAVGCYLLCVVVFNLGRAALSARSRSRATGPA
jgi:hypothetical protein